MPNILASLIQSDFGGMNGNFEAVILEGDQLVHWFRDNTKSDLPWKRGQVIVPKNVAGAGSIIQSDFRPGPNGNFEVIAPISAGGGTQELWHFFHDNSDPNLPWQTGQRVALNVAGPGCIIQSDYRPGNNGNFEVVVPQFAADGTVSLKHFFHDNSDANLPWADGPTIAFDVAGPATVIQSDFVRGGHGNFEVAAMLRAADGSIDLWHFFHDATSSVPWQRGQRIAPNVAGPGVLIQNDFRSGGHGNFDVVVRIGTSLVHFVHDNSDVNQPWQRRDVITDAARGSGTVIQSNYMTAGHGNLEVLAEECSQSVVHYWHPNQIPKFQWLRDLAPVVPEPKPSNPTVARKVVQLTGEYDREGWNGLGTPNFTINRTESRFRIRGCDLGSSFEHDGRLYFLFGDTWRVNQSQEQLNFDSVAFCTDADPNLGLHLTFLGQPPLLDGPVTQGAFDVPLDGISHNGTIYVFFSSNAYMPANNMTLMGRSVLGRSNDGGANYHLIEQLSSLKFINVSVEVGAIDHVSAAATGMPVGTKVLWIWGTGRYRGSDMYLSVMPLANIEDLTPILYFSGKNLWTRSEADAAPLFCQGDLGEISVRWNPFLSRWLALFNSNNPRGILMRSSPQPWGPWSAPIMIFDATSPNPDPCAGAGYGRFMHVPWTVAKCDHVQDDVIPPLGDLQPPFPFRDDDWGGEYGPYQITRYATGQAGIRSQIWFTMSTWNPYQVMLMTAEIPAGLL